MAVLQNCALFQENNDLEILEETKEKASFQLLQRLNLCMNSPTYLKLVYATFCGSTLAVKCVCKFRKGENIVLEWIELFIH